MRPPMADARPPAAPRPVVPSAVAVKPTVPRPTPAPVATPVVKVKPVVPTTTPVAAPIKPSTPHAPALARARSAPPPRPERREHSAPPAVPPPKHSRRTPDEQTRLYMNVGAEMGVATGDIVGAILGETGLPAKVVGTVDVRERHVFVDVASEHSHGIIAKLNRTSIKGYKLKVKVA